MARIGMIPQPRPVPVLGNLPDIETSAPVQSMMRFAQPRSTKSTVGRFVWRSAVAASANVRRELLTPRRLPVRPCKSVRHRPIS